MTAVCLVDTHCHLDFDRYDEDREAVLERARAAGVVAVINPAVSIKSSAAVCDLAADEPLVYASVGVHPTDTAGFELSVVEQLREQAQRKKVVAIGEIGLDYYWDRSPKDIQRRALEAQLGLAEELALPVILHNREATADILAMLETWVSGLDENDTLKGRPGVMHSFSGTPDDALRAVALGFYIGITGPVTFSKADMLREVVRVVPEDRLLIETDGPFLTPHPYRGQRNEPAYVHFVADRIATTRVSQYAVIAAETTRNAARLFGLPLEVLDA